MMIAVHRVAKSHKSELQGEFLLNKAENQDWKVARSDNAIADDYFRPNLLELQ